MKKTLIITTLAVGLVLAAPAKAAIYNYSTYIGNGIGAANVTVDTAQRTASFTGRNINLTFGDRDLANFRGGNLQTSDRTPTYLTDSVSGTFRRNGISYTALQSSRPKRTQFELASNRSFVWFYGRDRWGRILDFDGKGNYTRFTGSSGGSTSSSGGTPVPAPGMLGLLGLGLAGLAFGRRRNARKVKSVNGELTFA